MGEVGRIASIWRYPVKSMAGEQVASARIGELGLHADRTWAVRDVELGATTSAKRLPGLLWCTARYATDPPADAGPGHAPEVIIGLPQGREVSSSDPAVHAMLSDYLDRAVELRALPPIADRDQALALHDGTPRDIDRHRRPDAGGIGADHHTGSASMIGRTASAVGSRVAASRRCV